MPQQYNSGGSVLGLCFHENAAFNDGLHESMADSFLRFKPINASHISELACSARDKYPGQLLYGGSMDSSEAFNQVSASADYCLATATRSDDHVVIPLTNQKRLQCETWSDLIAIAVA
jgi:hypothetical protein